jgi:hypothetical protein
MQEEKMVNPAMAAYPEAPKLDLSKIKNLDALESKDSSFAKQLEKTVKRTAKQNAVKKFNFVEEYDIQLPSGGIFYQDEEDENIRKGIITIRPLSISEEEMMTNQAYIQNGSMFRRVYDSVIVNNFEAKRLCTYDSLYLMYALRNVSYGDDYTISLKCMNDSCGKEFQHTFNISEVVFDELDKDLTPLRVINLPGSKYTVTMKINRLEDDEELERMKKAKKDVSETILSYIIKTVELLDNEGKPVNPDDWVDFYSVLPVKDRVAISKAFSKDGTVPTISVICPKCGHEKEVAIPFQSDFFRTAF